MVGYVLFCGEITGTQIDQARLDEMMASAQDKGMSDAYQFFVTSCLKIEQNQRASIDDLLACEFLVGAANLKEEWKTERDSI